MMACTSSGLSLAERLESSNPSRHTLRPFHSTSPPDSGPPRPTMVAASASSLQRATSLPPRKTAKARLTVAASRHAIAVSCSATCSPMSPASTARAIAPRGTNAIPRVEPSRRLPALRPDP